MRRWFSWWPQLRRHLRSTDVDREIDDELRFHLEEEIAAGQRQGLTAQQARKAAHDSLGGMPLQLREQILDARGMSVVDDFRRDVRHGVRLLWRNRGFALVVVSTVAVAIGAAVTAFSIADAWLFRPLGFPAADRLVVAFAAAPQRPTEPAVWLPFRAYESWRDTTRSLTSISGAFFQGATWRTATDARSIVGMRVTPEFFATFGVRPLHGRPLQASDAGGPRALVLSHGFWQQALGGSTAVLEAPITLSDVSYTVVGIMPEDFDVRLLDRPEGAAFWTLLRPGDPGYDAGGIGPVALIGRLRDGVTLEAAQAEVAAITRRAEAAYPMNFNQFVVALSSLQADNTRSVRATLTTVLAAALCLLLIAAMNVGALLLGRGLGRRGEVAVRHALGAGRARISRQLLTESLVLSGCGAVLGVALAAVATRLFLVWNPLGTLPANDVHLDWRALAVAGGAMVVITIVSGLLPAVRISAAGPADALGGGAQQGRIIAPVRRAQTVMLVAQMAASVVLLICTALLARTFIQLRAAPLGFATGGLAVVSVVLPAKPFASAAHRLAFYKRLEEDLWALPGVRGVAASTSPPLAGAGVLPVNLTAVDNAAAPRMGAPEVTRGFFETLEIPVIAGRTFGEQDHASGAPVVVLNARAARDLFGGPAQAVGLRLRLDRDTWREVVGVVGDVRTAFFNTLEWRTDANVYRPAAQAFAQLGSPAATSFTLFVHVRSSRPLTAAELREAVRRADPSAAFLEVRQLPALVAEATRQPTFRMSLLLWFGSLSLLLAAIGVYGLVMQSVTARLREIALRVALGAEPAAMMASIVRGALLWAITGLVIGVAAAVLLGQRLEAVLYGVRPGDGLSLAGVGLLMLAVTGLAAWLPARRAAGVDPGRVLRG